MIEGSIIIANSATSTGGGLYLQDSNATLGNNNITANSAPSGGALAVSGSSPTITNNTIAGNGGQTGAGLSLLSCSPTIANTVVAFNASGVDRAGAGTLTFVHNCVHGNTAYDFSGLPDPTGTNGNISVDPVLASVPYGNWHIQLHSPCVDAGSNAHVFGEFDLDGQPRVQPVGGAVDIGADESDGTVWPAGPNVVVRVATDGHDANDGASWTMPKRTVGAAINVASALGGEVWVRAGTYEEAVMLYPCAHVYGGFAGTETQRDERDWRINITVLDAQRQGSVVSALHGHRVATIDGFTITDGIGTLISSERCGGGLYLSCASPTVANNRISGNGADKGGGLHLAGSSAAIVNNIVTSNTAAAGGGVYAGPSSSPVIANNAITGNGAQSGGGMYLNQAIATLVNNTVAGNNAPEGGGASLVNATPTMINTIIALNSSGVFRHLGGNPVLRHNCVYGNALYNYSGLSDPTGTNGNLSIDPMLASTEYGNWHLQPDSPCVDAGDNSYVIGAFDLDKQARIQPAGGTVDIGADEADGTTWPAGPYAVVRVSTDGDDQNDGSSWAAPKRTIAAALTAAAARGGQVWVRAGTYPECVTVPAHVFLYGGFGGTETQLQERNWNANPTVLDGQQQGSVVTILAGYRTGALDGFTITGGSGTEVAFSSDRYGGGLYLANCSPRIANNTIVDNMALGAGIRYGGGGYLSYSLATITDNTIAENTASDGGGFHLHQSPATIVNNVVTENTGSGLHLSRSDALVLGNEITSNRGSGLYISYASPTIVRNVISGNTTTEHGGGAYLFRSPAIITNNVFVGNSAQQYSGGLFLNDCAGIMLTNNTIVANSAGTHAGGIYTVASTPIITNTIIAFNSSGIFRPGSETLTLRHNCVFGNLAYDYLGLPDPTGTNGNIAEDPLLADCTYASNWHLRPNSPCADAGDNSCAWGEFDLDGQARIQPPGGTVDIGADESDGTVWPYGPYVVVRVSTDGDDRNDGASWTTPKRTVQAAIDAASAMGGEVWVRAGTYYERITLHPFAHVFGGFSGAETCREQRNWNGNVTTLDARQQGTVVTGARGFRISTIDGFTITGGTGTSNGPFRYGGGVYLSYCSPMIANNLIAANAAEGGAGLYSEYSSPAIVGNRITFNLADALSLGSAGGLYLRGGAATVAGNVISRNTARNTGGGAHFRDAMAAVVGNCIAENSSKYGGGISVSGGFGTYAGNSVVGNNATSHGGGIYLSDSSATFVNTIVAGNSSGVCPKGSGVLTWKHNCVYGNTSYNYYVTDPTGTNGNISKDPLFVDLQGGNYRLTGESPCIDAGDNAAVPVWATTDLDGKPRIVDGDANGSVIVDMGAYEFQPGPTICPGDLNCDGAVSFDDINPFVLALSNWPEWKNTYPNCPEQNADVNRDGQYGGLNGFGDINPFVELLAGAGGQPIPCP